MPRLAANSAFIRASGRRRAAQPQRNAACPTARMAAAADLMASGGHFVLPHLDGIRTDYRFTPASGQRFDWPGRWWNWILQTRPTGGGFAAIPARMWK